MAKKEKKYSFDEALAYAKHEAYPYWVNAEPLFYGAIDDNGNYYTQPIDEKINNGLWCIFFIIINAIEPNDLNRIYRMYKKRYLSQNIQFLIVIDDQKQLLKDDERVKVAADEWFKSEEINCPLVFDFNQNIQKAFGGVAKKRIAIISKGELVYNKCDDETLLGAEKELLKYIRETSPGFPGFMPYK